MNEVTKLNMVIDFWKHADEGLRDEFDRMRTGFNFYVGNQWDRVDLEKLQSEKRPALTINMILPIINLLGGIQRQGRQDVTVIARRGGIANIAEVLTETIRHCMDVTDADYETADCFLDGVILNNNLRSNYRTAPVDCLRNEKIRCGCPVFLSFFRPFIGRKRAFNIICLQF